MTQVAEILKASSPDKFIEKCVPTPYLHRGMIYSEAFAFCTLADKLRLPLVLESGTAYGRSTELIGKYGFPLVRTVDSVNLKAYSEEKNQKIFKSTARRLSYLKNVECLAGNSLKLLPGLIKHYKEQNIAVIIDGPKGKAASELAKSCMKHDNVKMVAIHDQIQARFNMDKYFKNVFYTSETWFRDAFGHLDKEDVDALNENGNDFAYDFPGFGLGIHVKGSYLKEVM